MNPAPLRVVAEVCRRLDGLPLALELAAGSWRVLGARGVLDAISADPLDVHDLQGARPAVHSSLRSALAASYGLLTDETRHVLHCLSVFRGGWTIEAATEVVGRGPLLDHLDRLAALGLVETHDDPTGRRFSMLPTIQAFAAAYATDAGITDALALRHADYFRRWVADLKDELATVSRIVLQRLHADGDNLRAALEWFAQHDAATGLAFASDLYRYWGFRGSIDEGLAWFDTLLQRAGPVEQVPGLNSSPPSSPTTATTPQRPAASPNRASRRIDAEATPTVSPWPRAFWATSTCARRSRSRCGAVERRPRPSSRSATPTTCAGSWSTSPRVWLNSATWPRPSAPSGGRLPSPASTTTRTGWQWGSGSWPASCGFEATWSPPIASMPSPIRS